MLRAIKWVVNLVLGAVRLPQRRFNTAVAERLVAAERSLRDSVAFARLLRDELTLQRATLDGLLREIAELREHLERRDPGVASGPRERS